MKSEIDKYKWFTTKSGGCVVEVVGVSLAARLERENERRRNLLEDVINELDLSCVTSDKHGELGTPPSELVRLVVEEKDRKIAMLKVRMKDLNTIKEKTCAWLLESAYDGDLIWMEVHTTCGEKFHFENDEFKEFSFCPHCGGKMKEKEGL
jgi:hypothetical protein